MLGTHQHTLKKSASCVGIGLHSGQKVRLTLHPAPADSGIVFVRTDVGGSPPIPARLNHVVDTLRATTLGLDGVTVSTVEHLLSALSGLGVDNARIEVNSAEVPIMDGSSAPFVRLIRSAGLERQDRPRKYYALSAPVTVRDGDRFVSAVPSRDFKVECFIDFDHPLMKSQSYTVTVTRSAFESEISRARTFGFLREVEYLKQQGLALGGSLDNAVVMDDFGVLNQEGLRYDNEFVRHKALDFIGDAALLGAPLLGWFSTSKAGHTLHNAFMRELLAAATTLTLIDPSAVATLAGSGIREAAG
jgi:UDP-3-O-[3-hydroxymyristoyl] N-acetylglucosamine deacetylase